MRLKYITAHCSVCGNHQEVARPISGTVFGVDLDGRKRGAVLDAYLERCLGCGYCAPQLDQVISNVAQTMQSEAWQKAQSNLEEPGAYWHSYSLLLVGADELYEGALAELVAVWRCEDQVKEIALAQKYLLKTEGLLKGAQSASQILSRAELFILLAEIVRRQSRFEEAYDLAQAASQTADITASQKRVSAQIAYWSKSKNAEPKMVSDATE